MNRFTLDSEIGQGAFSTVYRAKLGPNGNYVALKCFRKKYDSWSKACEIQEIKSLMAIQGSKHIISMLEMGRERDGEIFEYLLLAPTNAIITIPGTVYFVSPIYTGSIFDLLNINHRLSEREVARMTRQILSGLASLHAIGIIHRDLKPENILYNYSSQNELEVTLADLGSSVVFPNPLMSDYVTTRFYRSPEMLLGDSTYGPKIDVWATGAIAFEALIGRPLFPARGEADLLLQMCAVLGSPPFQDARFLRMVVNFDTRSIPKQFPKVPPRLWFDFECSPEVINCIASLVQWIPENRSSCETALRLDPFLAM